MIVSWNVRDLLSTCLQTLQSDLNQSGIDADILVVDNASTDGTPGKVAQRFPWVRLIANQENLGFAAANNLALLEVRGPNAPAIRYVWLLNPDTEVLPGTTRALLGCLERRPEAAVAGAKLLNADGSLQHGAFRFPGLVQLAIELYPLPARLYDSTLNGRYPSRYYESEEPFRVDHPLGASMMVRTKAIGQVGLLDEKYHMYCEEIDWCWRLRRAGWRSYCVPSAQVIHHAGQSSAQVPVASFVNLWRSRARLYHRFHGPVTRALARQMVRAGMMRRMRAATPEMTNACEEIRRAWRGIR